jgi:peptide/nickel transport system substrate-binding protein
MRPETTNNRSWARAAAARISRRRALGGAAAGAGSLALLAACGTRQSSSKPSGSGAGNQPKLGGAITVRTTVDPFDWDSTYVGKGTPNVNGLRHAYSSLLQFKSGPGVKYEDLILEPALAEKWETPDGQTYTFHLRKGLKFPNLAPINGRELTSSDVKFSYEYLSRTGSIASKNLPAADQAWQFEGLNSIQTPDPSTVVVKFDKPFVPFLNYMGSDDNPIMPHEIFDQYGNFKDHIAGTGAWQLDQSASQKGSRWVWKRNPDYWDSGKPYIDQVIWLVIQDDPAAFAAFNTKQVDILTGAGYQVNVKQAQQISKSRPDAVIQSYQTPSPVPFYMMVSKPPFNDLRIRQAVAYALDRDEMIQAFTEGKGSWALAGAFPDTFTQEEVKQLLKKDPAQSKQLLAAAGHPNGLDIEFIYPGQAYGDQYVQLVQLVQAQLKKVGINLNLVILDKQDWLTRERKHQFQMTFPAGKSLGEDIDSYLYAVFYPGSGTNYGDINDPQLAPLLDQQRRELDATKRKEVIRQAVKRINVDQVLGLALYYPSSNEVWSPRVANYGSNFGVKGWPLEHSWLVS